MKIFRHFILVLGLVIPVSLCLVLSVHAASPLNSSTRVDLSASVSGLSGSHSFYYFSNSYNYSVPFMMSGSIVQTLIEDRTISGELEADYNVRFQFPESMLGMRITGTWHIPLQYNVSEKYWWYDSSSDSLAYVYANQFQTLATDLTWRSQFSVKDQSFPAGLSVSLADRTASGSNWYDLTLVFDDFLIPSNFYSNYFSIDLTYYYNFQAYVNSVDNQSPIVEFLSAVTQDVSLSVRTNAYSSSSIVLSVPQLGNATNSQLYYDVLAAINNANISYDITVDGTDVTVDIDTSSLAQQTTVANILTVLNNIKSDSASIPMLRSDFDTFATAALTYLGNISASQDTIVQVLNAILDVADTLNQISSYLSDTYDTLTLSNAFDTVTTTSSSFSSSDLPLSNLVSYFVFQSGSGTPTTSNIRNFTTGTSLSVTLAGSSDSRTYSVSFDSTSGGAYDIVHGTGYNFVIHEFTSVTSVTTTSGGVYYWRLPSFMPYSSSQRTSYISNMGVGASGLSIGNINSLQNIIRFVPTDQTLNTKALADAYLALNPLYIICWEEVGSSAYFDGVSITPFSGVNSLSSSAFRSSVTYLTNNFMPYSNLSSLIAALTAGFTGLDSNSSQTFTSISTSSYNRWVSIIQQAISSQFSVIQSTVYPTYISEAGSWESTVHSYEISIWSEVNQRLSSILGSASPPAALLSAATWYTDAIESIWASLGVFGFVLSVSLIGGLIVVVLGKINQFPKGK